MNSILLSSLLSFLFYCHSPINSHPVFEVSADTIHVNIKGTIGPSIKYNNKYYCFFNAKTLFSGEYINHFYIISEDGNIEHKIEMPEELEEEVYYDLHLRKGKILVKTYWEHLTYSFNLKKLKWRKVKETDDFIYEDNRFYVTYLDFGEWGGTTWFKDKKTGIEYELESPSSPVVNKIDDIYYVSFGRKVLSIANPLEMKKSKKNHYYGKVEKIARFTGSNANEGTKILFIDSTRSFKYNFYIASSFTFNKQLFYLCSNNYQTSINTINNGIMQPVLALKDSISVFDYYYSHRGKNTEKNGLFLPFNVKDKDLFGFIEIKENKVLLHYIKNDYPIPKYIGEKEADNEFKAIFNRINSTLGSLQLSQIDSLEQKTGAEDITPSHHIQLGTSYYPNVNKFKLDTPRIYGQIEDSIITMQRSYYYTKSSNLIKAAFFEWVKTDNFYTGNEEKRPVAFRDKINKIEAYITQQVGKPTDYKTKKKSRSVVWKTNNGIIIRLHDWENYLEIRLVIHKD